MRSERVYGFAVELDRYQYLLLMAACLVLTLPLEVVARVWRRPRRLLFALTPTVVVFMIWDEIAVALNHWAWNPAYITGWYLPVDLPVEELVFFIVIPICALLTYGTVRAFLSKP